MDSPCVLVASSTEYDPRELVKRKLYTCTPSNIQVQYMIQSHNTTN